MAEGRRFVCQNCGNAVEAWDDGNPYYIDARGGKQYAYHPDPEREKCVGNDSPHLCLACAEEFMVDSRSPTLRCPQCGSPDISDTFELEGKTCPACKTGVFAIDPEFRAVS